MTRWKAAAQQKNATSLGSALVDPQKGSAAASPIPAPQPANKPAPGKKGPTGTQPRQTFSRVNTGSPPPMDTGASSQKSMMPDAMGMLPKRAAARVEETMGQATARMTIQDLIKNASAGVANAMSVSNEAARQTGRPQEKTASRVDPNSISTHYVEKLASAVEYISVIEKEAEDGASAGASTTPGPGSAPNNLSVTESPDPSWPIEAGGQGQATSGNQPPMKPSLQPEQVQVGKANTGLETNDDMQHPAQPVDPMGNSRDPKLASPIADIRKVAAAKATAKTASVDPRLVDLLLATRKTAAQKFAEDAIDPAQITSPASTDPAKPPPGASASEDAVPSQPADVNKQESLIGSNQAAIDYTKRQAKADPKSDVDKLLDEPALSASTDKTLQQTLDQGVQDSKISSAVKTAAARALLEKLAEDADKSSNDKKSKKEKDSTSGVGSFQAPPVGGVASSSM